MELTPQNVEMIFRDCLFREDESTDNRIVVKGIVNNYGFHPDRLQGHKDDVRALLQELPEDFQESGGRGASFLSACMTKHGTHWGEHHSMELLFCLGLALDLVYDPTPEFMRGMLPGGVPYYCVRN